MGIAVQFDSIAKRFPGVRALEDVSFEIAEGSCHALCGENGAGKSTLGKILSGLYVPDDGRLFVHGRALHFASPRAALAGGSDASIDISRPLGALTIAQQQMVQIASAVGSGASIIVFDEPTSSL